LEPQRSFLKCGEVIVIKANTPKVVSLALSIATMVAGCRNQAQPASTPASRAAEAKKLADDTKRDVKRLEHRLDDNPVSAEQVAKLSSLLDQLLRHMEETAQASQHHGDIVESQAKVAADVEQLQQVHAELEPPGRNEPLLDRISGNLAKVIQVASQGKELAGILSSPTETGQTSESVQSVSSVLPPESSDTSDLSGTPDSATTAASTPQPSAIAAVQTPVQLQQANGRDQCCENVVNAALRGRLGRVIVSFPAGTEASGTNIRLFRTGISEPVQTRYGSLAEEVLPGSYAVAITEQRVQGVAVQSGHDTRVRAGVLRVQAGPSTQINLLNGSGQPITTWYGARDVGLPPGSFHVEVSGEVVPVTIQDGKITNF
jgi:hypothetical protein